MQTFCVSNMHIICLKINTNKKRGYETLKKHFKIIILVVMCLALVGIYLGKNVYFKSESAKEQAKVENQNKNSKNNSLNGQISNKPSLYEFSTET